MKKDLVKLEEAEVLNQEEVTAIRVLRANPMTYMELAQKLYGRKDFFAQQQTYGVLSAIRKKLGIPLYPFNGPGSTIRLPKNKTEAEALANYIGRRARGWVRTYVKVLKYIDTKVPSTGRIVEDHLKQLEDTISIK